jgi:hypothetical protein
MIFSNYRELVTPKDAERWFAITPEVLADSHLADGHREKAEKEWRV